MPKTPVYENDFSFGRKDDVWRARQVPTMKAIAIPDPVKEPANDHFRFAVLRADPCHEGATLRRRQRIAFREEMVGHSRRWNS